MPSGGRQGVGAQLGGVVRGVGGAATPGLAGLDLDQAAPVVDAHQLETQADLHLLSGRAPGGRHRVKSVLAGHVVIGMDLGAAPVGDRVGFAVPGVQGRALLVQEDLPGLTPRGAVNAPARNIATPAGRLIPELGQVLEITALEEAFPDLLDAPLHLGLVPGMAHPGPDR